MMNTASSSAFIAEFLRSNKIPAATQAAITHALTVEGAAVEAVRCDIRTYYAVLATITYDSGDVVYVSALTKLASISDVVNLVESVSLS